MFPINPEIVISQPAYNDQSYAGLESLNNTRMVGDMLSTYLNSAVVYAYGTNLNGASGNNTFPLLSELQGRGRKKGVASLDTAYTGLIFGKRKTTSIIARTTYQPTDKPGYGRLPFVITFKDRWFQKNQTLYLDGFRVQCRVIDMPKRGVGGWDYTCEMEGNRKEAYADPKLLVRGKTVGGGVIATSLEGSRGTEHRGFSPFKTFNQLSLIRQSINHQGNVAAKPMLVDIKYAGKTFRYQLDFDRHLTEIEFMEKKELDLIFSQLNRTKDGHILNTDPDTEKFVPRGMGVWDAIPSSNEFGFTDFTIKKFDSMIDGMLSTSDSLDVVTQEEIHVFCGAGLMRLVDRAMKQDMNTLIPMINNDAFVRKAGDGLELGGYFTRYKHRSGRVFVFHNHPMFNRGPLADSMGRHPEYPEFSKLSFYGFAVDMSQVRVASEQNKSNVESNLMFLYEEGREYIEKTVEGMAKPIDRGHSNNANSDIDASGLHMMCSQGVHCNYPQSMLKIVCKA